MLLHYKNFNITYKFLIKHINEPSKTIVFLTTRNEDVSKKTLEEVLTLYLIKTDLMNHYNLVIVIYRNKFYLSRFVDVNKFREIHFKYMHRVLIQGESKVDEKISNILKDKIDIYYSMNAYFDKFDYDLLTREKKKEHRLKYLQKHKRKEKFRKFLKFQFLKFRKSA